MHFSTCADKTERTATLQLSGHRNTRFFIHERQQQMPFFCSLLQVQSSPFSSLTWPGALCHICWCSTSANTFGNHTHQWVSVWTSLAWCWTNTWWLCCKYSARSTITFLLHPWCWCKAPDSKGTPLCWAAASSSLPELPKGARQVLSHPWTSNVRTFIKDLNYT